MMLPTTIADAAAQLRDGRTTATELTEALLERAHALQSALGAFVAFTDEAALAAARQADADFARGVAVLRADGSSRARLSPRNVLGSVHDEYLWGARRREAMGG